MPSTLFVSFVTFVVNVYDTNVKERMALLFSLSRIFRSCIKLKYQSEGCRFRVGAEVNQYAKFHTGSF